MSMRRVALSTASLVVLCSAAVAQTRPDSGQVIQQQQAPLEAPKAASEEVKPVVAQPSVKPGGPKVLLKSVRISGNKVFSTAELTDLVRDAFGQRLDLAGLKEVADRVTAFYVAKGYGFAKAYVPQQNFKSGNLSIVIVEGRFGDVRVISEDDVVRSAEPYLAQLKKGEVITTSDLERATLLLEDIHGFRSAPIIKPGKEFGSGDLDVKIDRVSQFGGEVGVNNHGNRYTGRIQGYANLDAKSPFGFGDLLQLRSLYTQEGMWSGNLAYSMPVDASGLRWSIAGGRTFYSLGQDYKNLDATGTADVVSTALSYNLIRSQSLNITVSATGQYKSLHDLQGANGTDDRKHSISLPLAVNFDVRDTLIGRGITFGAISVTPGHLSLDSELRTNDATSAQTQGRFVKANIEVARLQSLYDDFSLYGRVAAQRANKNLSSSERFGLGGATSVRGFPTGEGIGDSGILGQIELRYAINMFSPFAFYDWGYMKTNQKPYDTSDNSRTLGAAGLGVRFQQKEGINFDAYAAWRTAGGEPQSDTRHRKPTIWLSASYKF